MKPYIYDIINNTFSEQYWRLFMQGHIVINCPTKEDAIELLKMCDEKGITWTDNNSLLENDQWNVYQGDTCYFRDVFGIEIFHADYFISRRIPIILFKKQ